MKTTQKKTKTKKIVTAAAVRFKTYNLYERAVEEGVSYGLNRAHKHTDAPTREQLETEIIRAVMGSLDEILVWDDLNGDVDE